MSFKVISVGSDASSTAMDPDEFIRRHAPDPVRGKRLAGVKKDSSVPRVGDTVVLNNAGLQQIYGSPVGLGHMKSLRMKVTHVAHESLTFPKPTFALEVDNEDINAFLIDHNCFDIVERA